MLTYPAIRILKASRNGLCVRGTGSSADHEVLASWLLGRTLPWVGSGEIEGGSFHVCFLLSDAGG